MDLSATIKAARSLNRDERIELVQIIWDEIAADATGQTNLTEAQKQELDRRLQSYEKAPDRVVPWEEVKAQAEARLKK